MLIKKQKPVPKNRTAPPGPMEMETAGTLVGRGSTSGDGPHEQITVGSGLKLTGTTLSAEPVPDYTNMFLFMGG